MVVKRLINSSFGNKTVDLIHCMKHFQDKCAHYWNDEFSQTMASGCFNIVLQSKSVYDDYVVRVLKITKVSRIFEILISSSLGVHVISEKIKQLAMPYENHTTEEGQNEYDKKFDQLY